MRAAPFRFALRGLGLTFAAEANLRIHLAVAEIVVYLGAVEGLTAAKWGLLILAIALVLGLELVNTAIERAVDLTVGERQAPLAAAAKDAAAGAVLIAAAGAAAVGLVVLWPGLSRISDVPGSLGLLGGLLLLLAALYITFRPPVRRVGPPR